MSELLNSSNSAQDLPISDMDAATDQSIAAAGTSDFVGGYNITSNVKTNKRFSFAAIANFVLSKFKPSALSGIGDGSATGAITALNSKTNVQLSKSSTAQDDKPWLVLQENFSSLPEGCLIGIIECAGTRSFFGYRKGNRGSFIVDIYATGIPAYRIVNENGTWKYCAIQTGEWTTV